MISQSEDLPLSLEEKFECQTEDVLFELPLKSPNFIEQMNFASSDAHKELTEIAEVESRLEKETHCQSRKESIKEDIFTALQRLNQFHLTHNANILSENHQ